MNEPTKIFSASQIRAADAFTISNEPVASIDLMERAAGKCVNWFINNYKKQIQFHVFCGLGNNGGDGLAIARLLHLEGYAVNVFIVKYAEKVSADFEINLKRLKEITGIKVSDILNTDFNFPAFSASDIIIDAIFGTGLSKPIAGLTSFCIERMNASESKIIAVDIPSGLFTDMHTDSTAVVVKADTTLSFQFPKSAFMFAENADFIGELFILDIGLSRTFIEQTDTDKYLLTENFIKSILKPRKKFAHKGTFGHALLIAGSYGKIGAAVLSSKGCSRSGVGLLTVCTPQCGYTILQTTVPEAMTITDSDNKILTDAPYTENFSAVGIGPGIGTDFLTQTALKKFLKKNTVPLVIDADALNILGLNKSWLELLPPQTVLTPHLKEFERLTQKAENDFERHQLQVEFSVKYKVCVVLKGAYTCITTPEGISYFNSTGNPGMAKGGSGDILTGIITGLRAQAYSGEESCLLGVYVHGLAGDLAKEKKGEIGMVSGDIVEFLPEAFLVLQSERIYNTV